MRTFKRVASFLFALVFLLCMAGSALAASEYSWDGSTLHIHGGTLSNVVGLWNSDWTLTEALKAAYPGYSYFKVNGTEISTISSTSITFEHNSTNTVQVGTKKSLLSSISWKNADPFTASIYDILTVNTVKDGATTTATQNVTRGTETLIPVNTEDGKYNVSIAYDGTYTLTDAGYTLAAITSDKTVTITYTADTDSTIQVGSAANASVTLKQESVPANTAASFTVAPTTNNHYISSVTVTDAEGQPVALDSVQKHDGQWDVTFTAGAAKTVYTVDVATATPILALRDSENGYLITYDADTMDATAVRNALVNLIGTALDGITDSNLTVQYNASQIGAEEWQSLDYKPTYEIWNHAFGKNASEQIRFLYNPVDDAYPDVTLDVTVNLTTYATVKLAEDSAADVSVTVKASGVIFSTEVTTDGVKIAQNKAQTINISVTGSNRYITGVSVTDAQGNAYTDFTLSDGAYALTLDPAQLTSDTYTVKVTTAPIFSIDTAVEYNSLLTRDEVTANVLSVLQGDRDMVESITLSPSDDLTSATVYITFKDTSDKYPTVLDYAVVTLSDVALKDSRPETEIVLMVDNTLTAYTGDYTNAELLEALFLRLQTKDGTTLTETFAGYADELTATEVDAGSDAQQTVTFTYAENKAYKGSTASVTFQLTPAPTDSTIRLADRDTASVQMAYGDTDVELTIAERSIPQLTQVNLTVTPAENTYIASLRVLRTLEDGTTELVTDSASFAETTATISFTAGTLENYLVEVISKPAALKLINGDSDAQSINYNSLQQTSVAEQALLALIDMEASDPVPVASNVTIQYLAGTVLGTEKWESLTYAPSGLNALAYHKFGEQTEERVRLAYDVAGDRYPAISRTFTVTLNDRRPATSIAVKDPQDTLTYMAEPDMATILAAICDGVVVKDTQEKIDGAAVKVTAYNKIPMDEATILKLLNAGEHTVTLSFSQTDEYQGCTAEVTFTIDRASAAIVVSSVNTTYNGSKIQSPITVTAADPNGKDKVEHITIVSGLDINGNAFINVDLPDSLGVGSLIGNGMTVSLKQVSSVLNTILGSTDIDSATIDMIKQVIDTIANMEALEDASVTITMGQNIMPSDSGVYLIAGIISDTNYTTRAALNYAIIKPQATEGKLQFNFNDENFVVLLSNLDTYDFGAHIVEDGLTDSQIEWANSHIRYVYLGATLDGTPTVSTTPPTKSGVYTQMAYLGSIANDMVYAAPIVRPFIVVTEPVNVKFTTEERTFTYDRQPHGLDAAAYAVNGGADVTSQGKLTVYYTGLETDGDVYGPTTTRPTECGVYNVTATFVTADKAKAGIATTTMTITLSGDASITVTDKTHIYDGNAVSVNSMVESSPSDAARTIITGAVKVDGDFSENGLKALTGVINVDFPARVDKFLDKVLTDRTLTASDLLSAIDSLIAKTDSKLDSDLLSAVRKVIAQLPKNATLTFKDNASYTDIGAYMVIGVITDPNYVPKMDTGVLLITPKVTSAELRWNYRDLNGIITRPLLDIVDLNASAFRNDAKDDALTARVEYVIIGMDDSGNPVVTNSTRDLPNGVYTQIAFITDGVSADMTVVKPITRTFTLVAQTANVHVEDLTVNYDGNQHSCTVTVSKADGTRYDPASLKVTYIGLNTESGTYYSTTAPTAVGAYLVVAEYKEYDGGQLKYVGGDVGYLTIKPAGSFDIADETTRYYDGTPKFVDVVSNPDNLPYISVIRDDAGNVNVVFPASWNVPQFSTGTVQGDLNALSTWLETNAPADVQNSELFTKLMSVLQTLSAHTLTINGQYPVEIGDYTVICIAYGANQGVIADRGVLHIIQDPSVTPTPVPTEEPTPTPTLEPEASVSPSTEPTDEPTASPSTEPTDEPTASPSTEPTDEPTASPSTEPTDAPTASPSTEPTDAPTASPSTEPTDEPTASPSTEPTDEPTATVTVSPTAEPTATPTSTPENIDLPKTGDNADPTLWITMILLSAAGLMILLTGRKRHYN